jgi:hypothetical protein
VVGQSAQGFVSRNVVVVAASPAAVWRRLVTPSAWWSSDHTFSGDAANLSLDPVPNGCFCERLPAEDAAPAKGAKPGARPPRGGVVHMRVVYVEHAKALRMVGALGPLQSEAVNATLTVTLKAVDGGTRVMFEYVVGGYMRYPADKIVPAVDAVMANQLISLATAFPPLKPHPDAAEPDAPADTPVAAPAPETAPGTGLGKRGVLVPRGRVWSLPPSDTPTAPPAPDGPIVAPLPTAPLPPDVTLAGGGKSAAKRGKAKRTVTPLPAPVAAPDAEPVAITPPPWPATVPEPEKPKPVAKKSGKAGAKPKPRPTPTRASDEPSNDAVNSAFDAALGDPQRPVDPPQ